MSFRIRCVKLTGMKAVMRSGLWVGAVLWLAGVVAMGVEGKGSERDVAEILRRLAANSADEELEGLRHSFSYHRQTVVFFFDEKGEVEKKVDRGYRIEPEDGKAAMKLVKENGKPVDPEDPKRKQWQNEASDNARKLDVNEELFAHYDFTLEGEEVTMGRLALVLSFKPKANPPDGDAFFGKLLNNLTGQIWVDAEDYQLARADVKLRQKVSFFGGIAGNIQNLHLQLARERVAPGVWLNRNSAVEIRARKLFSNMWMKAFENCTSFEKVSVVAQQAER